MTAQLVFEHQPGERTPAVTLEANRRSLEPGRAVVDSLLGLMDRCVGENKERNLIFHRRGIRMQKMYEGDHGDFHPTSGNWVSRPAYAMGSQNAKTKKTSPWYPHNKIRRYFDANTAQALQSRIDLRAIATRDDDRSQLAASCARPIVDYHERQICDELFVQEWDKQKRCYGEVFFFCSWDTNAGPEIDELGVMGEDSIPGGSIYTCLDCAQSGDDQDMVQGCPQCGGQDMVSEEYPEVPIPHFGVVGKKRAGDFSCQIVSKLQHDYDQMAREYNLAAWYNWTRRMRVEELQEQFDWYKVPVGREEDSARQVDYVESGTGNTGRNSVPYRSLHGDRRTTVRQFWFRPYMLDMIPEADVPLLGGEKIAKGWKLSEQYSHGGYVLFSGRSILDIWDDPHFDHRWVQLKHKHIPNRLSGDGGEDIIRPSQEYNEARSYLMSNWRFNAARPQIIRAPLKEGDWQLGKVATVAGLPRNVSIHDLHTVAEAVPTDPTAMAMLQQADAEMQGAEQAFSTVTGDPDVQSQGGGKTMGGLQLIQSNAQEMRLPELSLVALAYKKIHMNGLHFFKECATEERWVPFKAQAGELAGKYLKGADLDGDIELTFGKGSYLPKDSARKRANLLFAMEVGQGAAFSPQTPPKLRQLILDVAELDYETDDYSEDVKNARQRIEQMKQQCDTAKQMAGMIEQVAQAVGGQNAGLNASGIPSDIGSGGGDMASADDSYGNQGAPQSGIGGIGTKMVGQAPDAGLYEPNGGISAGIRQGGASGEAGFGQQPSGVLPQGMSGASGGQSQVGGFAQQPGQVQPGMMPPPTAAQILCELVPIDQPVDDHAVHYAFIRNWLKGDEARKVDPVVNEAMHLRLQEHEMGGAMQAAKEQGVGMLANKPMLDKEQRDRDEQNAREDANTAQQGQRDQQMKADDRTHQLVLEDKRQSGARDVAKMRTAHTKAAKK